MFYSQIPQKLKHCCDQLFWNLQLPAGGKGWKMWKSASVSRAFGREFLTKTVAEKSTHCRSICVGPKPRLISYTHFYLLQIYVLWQVHTSNRSNSPEEEDPLSVLCPLGLFERP